MANCAAAARSRLRLRSLPAPSGAALESLIIVAMVLVTLVVLVDCCLPEMRRLARESLCSCSAGADSPKGARAADSASSQRRDAWRPESLQLDPGL